MWRRRKCVRPQEEGWAEVETGPSGQAGRCPLSVDPVRPPQRQRTVFFSSWTDHHRLVTSDSTDLRSHLLEIGAWRWLSGSSH